jgi:Tfp pilus assembly protein PilF
LKKALDIFRSILGENHPNVADSYIGLGKVYSNQRDYQRSLEYHKKALQILIEALGDTHPEVAISYNSIGAVYYAQQDYIKAKDYFEKTLAKRLEIFGEQHPDVASSYNNLGAVYFSMGEAQNALQYYQKALSIRRSLLGEAHQETAESYNNIGAAYRKLAQHTTGLDYHFSALKILNQNLGEYHPAIADTYNEIATAYAELGAIAKAITHYQKAIYTNIIEKPTYSEERLPSPENSVYSYPTTLVALKGLATAWVNVAQNAGSSALTSWEKVIEVADYAGRLLHKTQSHILRENSRIDLSKDAHSLFAIGVYAAYKLDSITNGKNNFFKYRAFAYAEITKGSSLLLSLQNVKAKQIAGIPDSLLQLEKNLRDRLSAYQAQILALEPPKTKNDSAKLLLWQNEIFNVNREIEKLNARLEKEYPRYFKLKFETPIVSIKQLQETVLASSTKNQVLIKYFWDELILYIFYITPTEFQIFARRLHPNFRKWLNDLRYLLSDPLSPSLGVNAYAPIAYNLYKELFSPIQDRLENKNLIIIPDQELLRLPFEALITEPPALEDNTIHTLDFRNLPFLIKRNPISYHYSATLLFEQWNKLQALRKKKTTDFPPCRLCAYL